MRPVESGTMTAEEVNKVEKYTREFNQYLQDQAIVFQLITSTIPDSLYLKIKDKTTIQEAWDALKGNFEKRSHMITIELRRQLHNTQCIENRNIRTHFDTI